MTPFLVGFTFLQEQQSNTQKRFCYHTNQIYAVNGVDVLSVDLINYEERSVKFHFLQFSYIPNLAATASN